MSRPAKTMHCLVGGITPWTVFLAKTRLLAGMVGDRWHRLRPVESGGLGGPYPAVCGR